MKTELTDIARWTNAYRNPKNYEEFKKAERALLKVHDKYGTIDINIIKSLIN